jgi:hypothetical protein
MGQARYDEGEWPIVLVTLPKEALDGAGLHAHVEQLSAFSRREKPHVQIIDVRVSPALSAEARRLIVERMDQDDEAHPGILLGVGVVLSTAVHRGIFKAFKWLTRNPRPFEAFSDLEAAKVWARGLIAARSLSSHTMRVSTPTADGAVPKRAGER